jgi:hypothetical protein
MRIAIKNSKITVSDNNKNSVHTDLEFLVSTTPTYPVILWMLWCIQTKIILNRETLLFAFPDDTKKACETEVNISLERHKEFIENNPTLREKNPYDCSSKTQTELQTRYTKIWPLSIPERDALN